MEAIYRIYDTIEKRHRDDMFALPDGTICESYTSWEPPMLWRDSVQNQSNYKLELISKGEWGDREFKEWSFARYLKLAKDNNFTLH